MEFRQLRGKLMKDDDVIEVLEHYDMRVIYDFDRTHGNMSMCIGRRPRRSDFNFASTKIGE